MKDGAEGDEGKQSLVLILATCSSHWEKAVHGFRVWLYNPIMSMLKHWKNRIMNDETELKEHGFYFLEDTVISSLLWLAFRFGKKLKKPEAWFLLLLLLFEPFVVEGRTWRSQATVVGQKNVSLVLPIGFFFQVDYSKVSCRLSSSPFFHRLCVIFNCARLC